MLVENIPGRNKPLGLITYTELKKSVSFKSLDGFGRLAGFYKNTEKDGWVLGMVANCGRYEQAVCLWLSNGKMISTSRIKS